MRLACLTTAAALLLAGPALADSLDNAATVSQSASIAVGQTAESGAKVAAGVVSLPAAAVGASVGVGGASVEATGRNVAQIGCSLFTSGIDSAGFASAPLTVTDKVVVAPQGPPVVPAAPKPTAKLTGPQ